MTGAYTRLTDITLRDTAPSPDPGAAIGRKAEPAGP
jgi:hypothetical protein